MTSRRKSKKRPCRICRKWYLPNPRVAERQKTCGAEICKKKWHAKKCEEWNKNHPSYFSEIYLSKKLAVDEVDIKTIDNQNNHFSKSSNALPALTHPAIFKKLPWELIQEVMGTQYLVITGYIAQLLFSSFQEVIRQQPIEIQREFRQLPSGDISRGDRPNRGP